MRLTSTTFRRLLVKTISGEILGKIKGWELDTDEQMIVQYKVVSSPIRGRKFLIHRGQVRSFTETEMIVDDSVLREAKPPRRPLVPKPEITTAE